MSRREAITRLDVLKELGRMTLKAVWKATRIGLYLGVTFGIVLGGLYLMPEPTTVATTVQGLLDAVPAVVWTVFEWAFRIIGLWLLAGFAYEIWTHARERVQERENNA